MKHRHLDVPAGTPVESLPSAAIVDLLDRGDLDDWRPIAAAVARDPDGPFAERVARLIDAYPRYGTSRLWRAWIDRRRARAEGRRRAAAESATLAEIRKDLGLTQAQVAARASMTQSDLSKFERRADVRLSRLRAFAEALGGRLLVTVEVAGRAVEVRTGATAGGRRGAREGAARRRTARDRALRG